MDDLSALILYYTFSADEEAEDKRRHWSMVHGGRVSSDFQDTVRRVRQERLLQPTIGSSPHFLLYLRSYLKVSRPLTSSTGGALIYKEIESENKRGGKDIARYGRLVREQSLMARGSTRSLPVPQDDSVTGRDLGSSSDQQQSKRRRLNDTPVITQTSFGVPSTTPTRSPTSSATVTASDTRPEPRQANQPNESTQVSQPDPQLKQQEAEIAKLKSDVKTKDALITQLRAEASKKGTEVTKLKDEGKTKEDLIDQLRDEVRDKENEITKLTDDGNAKNVQITQLKAEVSKKEIDVTKSRDEGKTKDALIDQLRSKAHEKEDEVSKLKDVMKAKDVVDEQLRLETSKKEMGYEIEIVRLKAEIDFMRGKLGI